MLKQIVNLEYYINQYGGSYGDVIVPFLKRAERNINTITFNRLINTELTPFQLNICQECICQYAEFICDNHDIIDSAISTFGINGVNVSLSMTNLTKVNGVVIPNEIHASLLQTGLLYRGL